MGSGIDNRIVYGSTSGEVGVDFTALTRILLLAVVFHRGGRSVMPPCMRSYEF